jgi:hypothetical protein
MVIKSNHAAGETAMFSANREWGSKCIKLLMASWQPLLLAVCTYKYGWLIQFQFLISAY